MSGYRAASEHPAAATAAGTGAGAAAAMAAASDRQGLATLRLQKGLGGAAPGGLEGEPQTGAADLAGGGSASSALRAQAT